MAGLITQQKRRVGVSGGDLAERAFLHTRSFHAEQHYCKSEWIASVFAGKRSFSGDPSSELAIEDRALNVSFV